MKAGFSPQRLLLVLGGWLLFAALAPQALAQSPEAHWIWSPAHAKEQTPPGSVYFRKTFELAAAESAEVQITADDAYELYVNARHVGSGNNWKLLDRYDISQYLVQGKNTIAVKATCHERGAAGVVARVLVKPRGGAHVAHSTDASWKTSLKETPQWQRPAFHDAQWLPAQSFGLFGATLPWGTETHLAGNEGRFRVSPEFQVEQVATPEQTGSLIAMTFNEFGQIIAARENGPLLRLSDTNRDGVHDKITTYCDKITNCQGLLALNGHVLAIADGPDGVALYRLQDEDRNGEADKIEPLVRFDGAMREHGPHGLTLGPDGLLYIIVGNHAEVDQERHPYAPSSPLRHWYEGDLVQPRFEDPGGHAVGVKAPGGTIVRTDVEGRFVELFAGGIRNAYDLAFNRQGDLFTYDSDMEWDTGTPFYRPTRLNHVIPGAELGWRSGWAKWPAYYLDSLPATAETGTGSPTGMVFYNHFMFPLRYHNAMFVCDWSRGRINAVYLDPEGGSYRARTNVLVEGRPLNATDIAVGPDGWLYFCTGGRGTEGGIYCVTWRGIVPTEVASLGSGIERAIRQPQLQSAWGRQQVAKVRRALGEQWEPELLRVARDTQRAAAHRTRALDLMQLLGPFPPVALLLDLTQDSLPEVRAKAAYLLGLHSDEVAHDRLVKLLDDENATVRRQACESLVRSGYAVAPARLLDLLSDSDRQVAFAARRALERLPAAQWRRLVLDDPRTRVFLHGSVALLTVAPERHTALNIIARCERMLAGEVRDPKSPPGFISDHDFTDLLRVLQVAITQGNLKTDDVPALGPLLGREYPSSDAIMNRELVRLLVMLGEPTVTARMLEQLQDPEVADIEKIQIALHAPFLKNGWSTEQKMELAGYYETARSLEGGENIANYLDLCARGLLADCTATERQMVLQRGAEWPNVALAALATLPGEIDRQTLGHVIALDRQLSGEESEAVTRLRTGIVATLAGSPADEAAAYLRELYESDPARRETVAVGLAQSPEGENWPLLVRSLSILEGPLSTEVLQKLASVERRPDDPEALRQAILCALRLKDNGAPQALALLKHWTGMQPVSEGDDWQSQVVAWQTWFRENHPDLPDPRLPVEAEQSKWTYQELLSYLSTSEAGDAARGGLVFEQAQCAKCHRYGNRGESVGPDLTTVSRRFQQKEILQSIIFPSHVISDQYASQTLLTTKGRTLTGIVAPAGQDAVSVTQPNGNKVLIPQSEIDEIQPSKVSAMPAGLLDPLSLQQIADLFAYLSEPPRERITSRRSVQR